ncbi:restriction endonuclease subunit S, partial [Priestia megaterium]|uniref:restriction endonuclease subunit S n=1 Tax=Priestia megaterium TaxID=1404 RepID=UPI002FFE2147
MAIRKKEDLLREYYKEELEGAQKNWLMVELGDLCNFKRGPFGSSLKKNMFVPKNEKTYKVYEQGNAIRKTIDYGTYYISEEHFNDLKGFSVQEGDIIVSCAGTIGETFVIPPKHELGVINQALMRVRLTPAILTEYFLLAFDFYIKETAIKSAQGTAIKNLPPISEMKKMKIGLPSLEEQRRIVDRVSSFYVLLNKAQQLIKEAKETFELRRAAIFRKVYGEPQGIPDDCWRTLGELFHVQIGSTPSRKNVNYWGGDNCWLSSGEVNFCRITDSKEKVTDLAVKEARLKLAPKGSILFGMIGEGKTRGQVAILDMNSYHNQNMASIWVSETNIPSEYVYYWLVFKYTENRQNSSGNNQPAYNKSRVQALKIPIYDEEVMKVKVKQLEKLNYLENKIQSSLDLENIVSSLKNSILMKAFKGELGTNDPN